jgi:membrane protease YdiL (CAAX protease family)
MPRLNIIICLVLVATVLAFPVWIFDLSPHLLYLSGLGKGIVFISILYTISPKEILRVNLLRISSLFFNKTTFPAIGILVIYLGISIKRHTLGAIQGENSLLLLLLLITTFVAAFAEEFAFRLYIQANLIRLRLPIYKVILISSGLFAIIHCLNFFKYEKDIFSIINQVIVAFFMGILLASLFFITKSLMFTAFYHFFINLPGALSKIRVENLSDPQTLTGQSLVDNITGSLLFILFISPLIIISLFYLGKIRKDEQSNKGSIINTNSIYNF